MVGVVKYCCKEHDNTLDIYSLNLKHIKRNKMPLTQLLCVTSLMW